MESNKRRCQFQRSLIPDNIYYDGCCRWDVNATGKLPEYMKICFLALFNTTNDTAYKVMKEKGLDIIPHLTKAFHFLNSATLGFSGQMYARHTWWKQGDTTRATHEEYLENALVSVSGDDVSQETLEDFHGCPEIARRWDHLEPHLREHVAHALELPLNWRMPRLQTRSFIEACQQRKANTNPVLLELAKLDFNRVQSIHQRELREVSRYFELALLESCHVHSALVHKSANFSPNFWLSIRWWRNLGLAQRLRFSRDRLMENYFWTVGWAFEPQFARCSEAQTKANCLITTIDDVYDVYGTMDELELFTDAVDRWDVNATGKLPEYMKICFLALFNTTNDTAYKVMKEKGLDIIPHLTKAFHFLNSATLGFSGQMYARHTWWKQGDTTRATHEEYLENALVSVSGDDVSQETLEDFHGCPEIARRSSMILRLCDDLGTSKDELERGDVPKSIQCYMHESGLSEYEARYHIRRLIREKWRAINGDPSFTSRFEENLKMMIINVPRMAQCMCQYGDGHGKPNQVI
ncbi:hypothetical protein C4D60_Mb04t07340 [Musa balbisiana]|uniref:Terpene synthase metal-binding domain-containing protein n=1 Tax=Musa balbisiana TaxID=52838 RepID=A0A4S8KAA0_MUSBA|nr:hypothetical protein C4D60_Mb04t07340 [Musa balbisiana]